MLMAVLFASAQVCNPDLTVNSAGIFPDSATNLPPAYVDQAYSVTITARVPADTLVPPSPFAIPITNITVGTITINPPLTGFQFQCNVTDCAFPGGQINCGIITANPTVADLGEHVLTIPLTAYTLAGVPLASYDLTYYKIIVGPANNIFNIENNDNNIAFDVYPNPSSGARTGNVDVYAPKRGRGKGKGFNPNGQLVWEEEMDLNEGKNTIEVDFSGLPKGVYFYTIQTDAGTATRKVIITE